MDKLTIKKDILFKGIGVHSGKVASLLLRPSDSGEIVFKRTDLENRLLPLDPEMAQARNCSGLVAADCVLLTVEHLLATLSVFRVDSLLIELDGEEIPILDGSALPFAEAIDATGTRAVAPGKRSLKVIKPFRLREGEASLEVLPDSDLSVSYSVDYDHPAIGKQSLDIRVTAAVFLKEIAPARTFGFLKDLPELRKRGLAGGSSFQNTVVLDEEKVVSGPLRYPDEFVRHKILDLVGDLYWLGRPVVGRFEASKAGHGLHLKAVRFMLDHPDYLESREE